MTLAASLHRGRESTTELGGGSHSWGHGSHPCVIAREFCPPEGAFRRFLFLNLDPVFVFYRLFRELTLALHLLPSPQRTFPCPPGKKDMQVPGPQSACPSCPAPPRPFASGRWGGCAERSRGDGHTPSVGWAGSPLSLSDHRLPVSSLTPCVRTFHLFL